MLRIHSSVFLLVYLDAAVLRDLLPAAASRGVRPERSQLAQYRPKLISPFRSIQ